MNTRVIELAFAVLLFGWQVTAAAAETDAYADYVHAWRTDRLDALRADDGYLNLAALFWLDDRSFTFGGSRDNDLVFPRAPADRMGRFIVSRDGVTMQVEEGVPVVVGDKPVTSFTFDLDPDDVPVPARSGSLSWYVIDREGSIAVRVHDLDNPALSALPPIPHFDIDPRYRVVGRLKPYAEPRIVSVGTVIDGLPYRPVSPGVVEFELDGARFELEAYASGERLFFVFGDRTSGRETYGAGRFLYSAAADADGLTVLDFNLAYNPPCAFNDFSTCPVASPRNRLKVRIPAGEKYADEL